MDHSDSIHPSIKPILDLFASDLPDVKFPDVDRQSLEETAAKVRALSEEATQAELALKAALAGLAETQEELKQKAQRALAYATVYAQGNPELLAKIEMIPRFDAPAPVRARAAAQARPQPPAGADPQAPAKRRGRPKKAKTEEEPMATAEEAPGADASSEDASSEDEQTGDHPVNGTSHHAAAIEQLDQLS